MKVAVIMGSSSDWKVMQESCAMLDEFEIPYEKKVVSAHRTPKLMYEFASQARTNGYDVIIAVQVVCASTRNGCINDNNTCYRCTD